VALLKLTEDETGFFKSHNLSSSYCVVSCGNKDDIDAILYLRVMLMLMEKDVYSHGVNNAPCDDNAHQCSYFDVSVVSSNWRIW
jgi:hypothetical protein